LNPFSRIGFFRVRRDSHKCIDCGKCAKACPTAIPVNGLMQVTAARCLSCMQCIDQCPTKAEGALFWGPPRVFGHAWSRGVLVVLLLLCVSAVVAANYMYPLPSYIKTHGTEPATTASVLLTLEDLSCRGRANLLFYFLERDDLYEVPGYFRLDAWPGLHDVEIRVWYDPLQANEQLIKEAITEPYFEPEYGWRESPFTIKGYDVLGLGLDSLDVGPP
jgi:ferredoxin